MPEHHGNYASCCSNYAGVEGDVRLVDEQPGGEPGAVSGFLQVFHAGAWGALCEGSISEGYYYYGTESEESHFDPDFVRVPPVFSDVWPQRLHYCAMP